MRIRPGKWLPALVAVVLIAPATSFAGDGALPVVDGREVLATVNGEAITGEDLRRQIGTFHGEMAETQHAVQPPDPLALLERMIDAKLIVQEARNIGLDELPEVTSTMESGRKELLKRLVIDQRVSVIDEGDPAAVKLMFEETVQEAQIQSVLFQTREDATAFETTMDGETSFEQAAEAFVESGRAVTSESEYLKVRGMLPEVAAAVRKLEPGSTTPPIDVPGGIAVIKLVDFRYPEDAEARAQAESVALTYRREQELRKYSEEMRERYVKLNEELIDSLDYGSDETSMENFRNDKRVLAKVKGAKPVTVGELTRRLEMRAYHGLDEASARRRINDKLRGVLDHIVLERAVELEAKRLDIVDGPAYDSALRAQEQSLLFGSFVRTVVNPDIRLPDEEVEAYYQAHIDDYKTPAMIRLRSLPFRDRKHAEAGLQRLQQGSDWKWMRANATGVITARDETLEILEFNGRPLAVLALPEGIRAAVEGAAIGDFRLFAQPDGPCYVLAVEEFFPSRPRGLAEVRDQVLQRAFVIKREEAIDRWTDQLREHSEIRIHASEAQLRAVVGLGSAEGT